MPARPQRRRPPQERQVFGLTILHPSHPEVQRLQHGTARPGLHGHKVWPASFVLLDYLHQRGVAPQARVLGLLWLGPGGHRLCQNVPGPGDGARCRRRGVSVSPAARPAQWGPPRHPARHLCGPHPGPRGVRADRGPTSALGRSSWTPCTRWYAGASPRGWRTSCWRIPVGPRSASLVHGVCSTATPRCWPGRRRHPSGKAAGFSGWSALPRPQWAARRVGSPQRHRRRSWPRTVTTVRGGQHGAVRRQEERGSLTGRPVSTLRSQTGRAMGQGIGALAAADSVGIDHARIRALLRRRPAQASITLRPLLPHTAGCRDALWEAKRGVTSRRRRGL